MTRTLLARWAKTSGKRTAIELGWNLELNRLGVETAAATGCWAGMATSNFCGPQFVGMWRGELWHKELTRTIHES